MSIFRTADRPMPEARDGTPQPIDPEFWKSNTWARMKTQAMEQHPYCIKCKGDNHITVHMLRSGFDLLRDGATPQANDCIVICWDCLRKQKKEREAQAQAAD